MEAHPLMAEPRCNACGESASHIEIRGPNSDGCWRFIYRGIVAGNGQGQDISNEEASRIAAAFAQPFTYEAVHQADLYDDAGFCAHCGVAYCYTHWHVSDGYGASSCSGA
jgi:hypothetical protein